MPFRPGQSGNPAGRPKGSVNRQLAMLREAVEKVLPLVVERACNGDAEAQKIILERGLPKLKPVEVPMEFEMPNGGNATAAKMLMHQAAAGEIPLSVAERAAVGCAALMKIEAVNKALQCQSSGNAYIYALQHRMQNNSI